MAPCRQGLCCNVKRSIRLRKRQRRMPDRFEGTVSLRLRIFGTLRGCGLVNMANRSTSRPRGPLSRLGLRLPHGTASLGPWMQHARRGRGRATPLALPAPAGTCLEKEITGGCAGSSHLVSLV